MSNHCSSSKSPESFAIGMLIGAVVGGVAALLLAPQSGEETRKQLRSKAQQTRMRADLAMKEGRDLLEDAENHVKNAKRTAHHLKHEAKEKLDELRGDGASA